jgi:hypothetical protein
MAMQGSNRRSWFHNGFKFHPKGGALVQAYKGQKLGIGELICVRWQFPYSLLPTRWVSKG